MAPCYYHSVVAILPPLLLQLLLFAGMMLMLEELQLLRCPTDKLGGQADVVWCARSSWLPGRSLYGAPSHRSQGSSPCNPIPSCYADPNSLFYANVRLYPTAPAALII